VTRDEWALVAVIFVVSAILCWGGMILLVPFGAAYICPVFSWVGGWVACLGYIFRHKHPDAPVLA
jgi:hypothetical protein